MGLVRIFQAIFGAVTLTMVVGMDSHAATDTINPMGDPVLSAIVAPDILPYSQLEARGASSYKFDKDEYGNFITLTVDPGLQPVKNGAISSELSVNYPFNEGDTVRYSWRMRVPYNLVADAPANRWWLLARWNAQPNPRMGESPEDYLVYNPVMMFNYKMIEHKDTLSVSYGVPEGLAAGSFGLKRSAWVKFTAEITWSRSDNGKARIFVNDGKVPEREISGPNMYNKYQTIFRLGINRSSEIKIPASIQIGDVKIERISGNGPVSTEITKPALLSPAR